jgi:signal transduction histidine kinase
MNGVANDRYASRMARHPLSAALIERGSGLAQILRRWWRNQPMVVRDAPIAVVLALLAFLPALAHSGTRLGEMPYRPSDGLAMVAALAQTLPLTFRRLRPAAVLLVVLAGFVVQDLRGYHTFAGVGLVVALYSAAAHQERFRRRSAAALTAGYVALAVAEHAAGSSDVPQDFIAFYALLAVFWLVGGSVRAQRQRDAERYQLAAAAVRAAERARIAHELHDVVTHHVTAMVVQANAAGFLAAYPDRLATNLDAIGDSGRRALGELRDLLEVLDPARTDAPAPRTGLPDLSGIPALVAETRAAGQPIELVSHGCPAPMGAGRELAAYRVVQEALTNALKYAAGCSTEVRVAYRPDGVAIVVSTAAAEKSSASPVGGSGRGLAGIRERVELFGGSLSAGPQAPYGFVVCADIPVAAGERT